MSESVKILQENQNPEEFVSLLLLSDIYLKKALTAARRKELNQELMFKKQTINTLNQASKIVHSYFPKDSPHIKRIQDKLSKRRLNLLGLIS